MYMKRRKQTYIMKQLYVIDSTKRTFNTLIWKVQLIFMLIIVEKFFMHLTVFEFILECWPKKQTNKPTKKQAGVMEKIFQNIMAKERIFFHDT